MTRADKANFTVFIVEDNRPLCEIYAELLSDAGYAVKSFSSGEEALAKMPAFSPPNLLLIDFSLATMSGETFVGAIKERMPELAGRTMIAGSSGHHADSAAIASFKNCVDVYFEKHQECEHLVDAVDALLRTR